MTEDFIEVPNETVAGEPIYTVQSPVISHADPVFHTIRDVDGLPIPHPAEQPRHVIERALDAHVGRLVTKQEEAPVHVIEPDVYPVNDGEGSYSPK